LPTANTIRTGSGKPGKDYWQQRADYTISATLDTTRRALSGEEKVVYTNNSPDTLRYVWMQLDQNLFRPDSRGALIYDQSARFGTAGADGGFVLSRVGVRVLPAAGRAGLTGFAPVTPFVNGTMMRLDLARPLPPGRKLEIDVAWSFPFGPNGNRMGIEKIDGSDVYEVAQWYPRMAVYDDVRGWNTEQYYGQGEFYLEYGSFDVSLTVPVDMLIGATGTLQNPAAVLTPTQRQRLAQAKSSATTVVIRGKNEIGDPASRPRTAGGSLTWRFTADSVRDFAWAAARHFIWDAVGADSGRVLAQSFYPPSADSIWNRSSEYVKHAIEFYGGRWLRYPYPTMSNINGIEGGMEYPMIVFCRNRTSPTGLFSVTDHEVGHSWWPMIVGNNERLYPWMDEGFNTFQNYYSWEAFYGSPPPHRGSVDAVVGFALSGNEQAALTPADRTAGLGVVAYQKPGFGLRLLRDQVLGADRYDNAMREYARRWAFHHPTPADFFRTIEDYTGEDLSWFWYGWFYTTETLDQAVDSVTTVAANGRQRIFLRNAGPLVMPVRLGIGYEDGTMDKVTLPVEIWFYGNRYFYVVDSPKKINAVTVDPDTQFPDVDRSNNSWRKAATP
ncbi:MAG TPA: M1 family metallopeptidase, partial [Gemmatimonadales bacterium]|nr:M1 family metallopeptidase [Gemmatimonadales bacterium]